MIACQMGFLGDSSIKRVRLKIMGENQIKEFFLHGVIKRFRIVGMPPGFSKAMLSVAIEYTLNDGDFGLIQTRRGSTKIYRLETAVMFLKQLGVRDVLVDLASIDEPQGGLVLG